MKRKHEERSTSPVFLLWGDLLDEMRGEVVARLQPYEHLSLSLTSKDSYRRFRLCSDPFTLCTIVQSGFESVWDYVWCYHNQYGVGGHHVLYDDTFFHLIHILSGCDTRNPFPYSTPGFKNLFIEACRYGSLRAVECLWSQIVVLDCRPKMLIEALVAAWEASQEGVLLWFKEQRTKGSDIGDLTDDSETQSLVRIWNPGEPSPLDYLPISNPVSIGCCILVQDLVYTGDVTLAEWRYEQVFKDNPSEVLGGRSMERSSLKRLRNQPWEQRLAFLEFIQKHPRLGLFGIPPPDLHHLIDGEITMAQLEILATFGMTMDFSLVHYAIIKKGISDRPVLTLLQALVQKWGLPYVGHEFLGNFLCQMAYKKGFFDTLLWLHVTLDCSQYSGSKEEQFVTWAKSRRLKVRHT